MLQIRTHHLRQQLHLHRFHHKIIHAAAIARSTSSLPLLPVSARIGTLRASPQRIGMLDSLGSLTAIHFRHLHIQNYTVNLLLFQKLQGTTATAEELLKHLIETFSDLRKLFRKLLTH